MALGERRVEVEGEARVERSQIRFAKLKGKTERTEDEDDDEYENDKKPL